MDGDCRIRCFCLVYLEGDGLIGDAIASAVMPRIQGWDE